jgi:hypothetical protein
LAKAARIKRQLGGTGECGERVPKRPKGMHRRTYERLLGLLTQTEQPDVEEQPIGNWGNYVYGKMNAVPLFETELAKLRRAGRAPSILLSSVTDAYQGA